MMTTMAPSTLGALAQAAIAKYLRQSIRYEKDVLADTDPENLHQMRVGLRRLRTALQVFLPSIHIPPAAQSHQVGKIARQLGKLRDLDVVIETLEADYLPDLPPPEQALLNKVLKRLQKQRTKRFKQVKRLLKGKRYRRLKTSLHQWLETPVWDVIAPLPAIQAVPDLVLPLVSQTWLHPGWLVGADIGVDTVDVAPPLAPEATDAMIQACSETLHSLRKQIKRFRYQLKVVSNLYGDALEADLDRLAEMQDNLGFLQDSWVMTEMITQVVPKAQRKMPTLTALIVDRRHRAWETWQQLQRHYLNHRNRVALRQLLANPAGLNPQPGEDNGNEAEAQQIEGDTGSYAQSFSKSADGAGSLA